MAEAFLRNLAGDYFETVSVGIDSTAPTLQVIQVMREIRIDITQQKPKTVREALKEHFGCVVSIADSQRERSPIFPLGNLARFLRRTYIFARALSLVGARSPRSSR